MSTKTYEYLTLPMICELYPFTKGQMRGYLMHKKKSGLDLCIRKIGKNLFFRKDLFELWIESHAII